MDTEALVASLDEAMAGKDITPDDFVDFVKRVSGAALLLTQLCVWHEAGTGSRLIALRGACTSLLDLQGWSNVCSLVT
jgi:hypothetical protein